jgi:hypothetical protein
MALNKYGVKEVADVTVYDLSTGKPILFLDTLKVSTIENTAENSAARGGKGNPKLLEWDFNREANVTMQDALMSPKSIALMTGNEMVTGAQTAYKREKLVAIVSTTAGQTKVTTSETFLTGTVYTYKDDEITEITPVSKTGSVIEFTNTNIPVGATVVVYYQFTTDATAQKITISADKFPSYVKVVGDTLIRNSETGVDEPFQFVINKAKVQPNFTLTFQADGDPTVFDMNLTVFRTDDSPEMISLIKY